MVLSVLGLRLNYRQKTENRKQKTEGQKAENRRQKTEGRKAENRTEQKAALVMRLQSHLCLHLYD